MFSLHFFAGQVTTDQGTVETLSCSACFRFQAKENPPKYLGMLQAGLTSSKFKFFTG